MIREKGGKRVSSGGLCPAGKTVRKLKIWRISIMPTVRGISRAKKFRKNLFAQFVYPIVFQVIFFIQSSVLVITVVT